MLRLILDYGQDNHYYFKLHWNVADGMCFNEYDRIVTPLGFLINHNLGIASLRICR